jgi:hypothetical protein
MMKYFCNPSTQEVEAEDCEFKAQSQAGFKKQNKDLPIIP